MLTDQQLKAFGRMAISYTWLDGKVSDAIGWLSQKDPDATRMELAGDRRERGFCKRLTRITALADKSAREHGHEPTQVCTNIEQATERVRNVSDKRNELIHSHLRWTLAGGTLSEALVDPIKNCELEDYSADALWELASEFVDSATELEAAVRKFMEEIVRVAVPEVDVWYPPSEDNSDSGEDA